MNIYRFLTILAIGGITHTAAAAENPQRIATYEELTEAGFNVPFHFTHKIKLTYGLLQQAKAEIAAQRRINELLNNIRTQADADAAAQELQQLRAAFSTGTQADIVALFILECYPEAVPMVYAYEDLKLKLKEANYHGSSALKSQLK